MMSLATVSARTLLIVLWCSSGTPAHAQIPLPAGTDALPEANRRILTAACTNAGKAASLSATMSDRFDREAFRKLENATAQSVLSGAYERTLSPEFIAVGGIGKVDSEGFQDASKATIAIPGCKSSESLFRIPLGKVGADSRPLPGDIVHFRSKPEKSQFFAIIYGDGNPSRTPKVKSTLLIFNYTGLLEAAESKKFNSLELNSFPPRITDKLLRAAYPKLYGSRLQSGLRKLLFQRNNGYAEARLGIEVVNKYAGVYAGYYMRSQFWVDKDLEYRVLRRNYCPPLRDMSTLQSPGISSWKGGVIGTQRTKGTKFHAGWDPHAPEGTPVYAAFRGTAVQNNGNEFGLWISLRGAPREASDVTFSRDEDAAASDRLTLCYAHLSKVFRTGAVMPGDLIGYAGSSGNADPSRPHLHFEIRDPRMETNPIIPRERGIIDPAQYFVRPTMVVETLGSRPLPIQDWPDQPGVDWLLDRKSREPIIEAFPAANAPK